MRFPSVVLSKAYGPRRSRRAAAVASAVALAASIAGGSCAVAEPTAALDIKVRARAIAAGEPVRVVVTADRPLRDVSATLLDQELSFHDLGAGLWAAWAVIPLDRMDAATAIIEARATTVSGAEARGAHMIAIEARTFPEENLSVASKYVEPPESVQRRIAEDRRLLAEIYALRTPPHRGGFVLPVDGPPTSVFGTRRLFNGQPRAPHSGLDLRAATGTPVASSGPGRVVMARDLYYSGNTVIVDHGGGLFTLYAHLDRMDVAVGADVPPGHIVGLAGATGRVTGPHLHWGAKIDDVPFDPRALLDPALFPTGIQETTP